MRLLFSLLLVAIFNVLPAQQKSFLDIGHKKIVVPVFVQTFEDVFADSTHPTSITIGAEELDKSKTDGHDFSKLDELEAVLIQFAYCPDSSDAAKKMYIGQLNGYFKNIGVFARCPKLKTIVFKVGEQIYITKAESERIAVTTKDYEKQWEKMASLNIEHAWTTFGTTASRALPGMKLYAVTWGW